MQRDELESTVRRWIEEGWQLGRTDVVDRLHAPSFVDHDPSGRSPDGEGFKSGIAALYAAFPDFRASVEDLVLDEGRDLAAVRWSAEATHRGPYLGFAPTGRTVRFKGIEIVRLEGARIAERWGEWDGLALVRQLGPGVASAPDR